MSEYFVEVTEAPTTVVVSDDTTYIDVSDTAEQIKVSAEEVVERVNVEETPVSTIITEPQGRTVYMVDFLHIQVYS
jgi:hypothetical protein